MGASGYGFQILLGSFCFKELISVLFEIFISGMFFCQDAASNGHVILKSLMGSTYLYKINSKTFDSFSMIWNVN